MTHSSEYAVPINGGIEPRDVWSYLVTYFVHIMLVVILCMVIYIVACVRKKTDGFSQSLQRANSGPQLRFYGEPTDSLKISGFTDAGSRTKALWNSRKEPFINARESPYYASSSNRRVRREDREKEAVRQLAKINQERLRRKKDALYDPGNNDPIPWDQFRDEWYKSNPLDDDMVDGFREEDLPAI